MMSLIVGLALFMLMDSCDSNEGVPVVDNDILALSDSLKGTWVANSTFVWLNSDAYETYSSSNVDCTAPRFYAIDAIKEFEIKVGTAYDSLKISNSYFCSPGRLSYLSLRKDRSGKIVKKEYGEDSRLLMVYELSVTKSTLHIVSTEISSGVVKPNTPYKYEVYLNRK